MGEGCSIGHHTLPRHHKVLAAGIAKRSFRSERPADIMRPPGLTWGRITESRTPKPLRVEPLRLEEARWNALERVRLNIQALNVSLD